MATTFTLIQTYTIGSGGAAAIEFTSIPATFTDICIKYSVRTNYAYTRDGGLLTFNGSTTTYSGKYVIGYDSNSTASGSSASTSFDAFRVNGDTATASTFGNMEIYVANYASGNYKSFSVDDVTENNSSTSWYLGFAGGLWSNVNPITSVKVTFAGTILQYSTASLYGILKA